MSSENSSKHSDNPEKEDHNQSGPLSEDEKNDEEKSSPEEKQAQAPSTELEKDEKQEIMVPPQKLKNCLINGKINILNFV